MPKLEEFTFFRDAPDGERPPVEAGAAMLALIAAERFPSFGLAFYEALHTAGQGQPPPSPLALVADDAILLAPQQTAAGWAGFLIAEDSAADQVRAFQLQETGQTVWLAVPPAPGSGAAVWAVAAASLPIQPSPHTLDSPSAPPG